MACGGGERERNDEEDDDDVLKSYRFASSDTVFDVALKYHTIRLSEPERFV